MLQVAQNKLHTAPHAQELQQRKDELVRRKAIKELQGKSRMIPETLLQPIRDCRQDPSPSEQEALHLNPYCTRDSIQATSGGYRRCYMTSISK